MGTARQARRRTMSATREAVTRGLGSTGTAGAAVSVAPPIASQSSSCACHAYRRQAAFHAAARRDSHEGPRAAIVLQHNRARGKHTRNTSSAPPNATSLSPSRFSPPHHGPQSFPAFHEYFFLRERTQAKQVEEAP